MNMRTARWENQNTLFLYVFIEPTWQESLDHELSMCKKSLFPSCKDSLIEVQGLMYGSEIHYSHHSGLLSFATIYSTQVQASGHLGFKWNSKPDALINKPCIAEIRVHTLLPFLDWLQSDFWKGGCWPLYQAQRTRMTPWTDHSC